MSTLIRQIQPVWAQLQQLELPVPAHALRRALLALAAGLLLMAGIAAGSSFWAPTRAWWLAAEGGSALVAGLQASLLAAIATAVGALPVFLVQRVSKRQESAFMAFAAGVMLAAAVFALLLPSLEASRALVGDVGWSALLTGAGLALGMGLMLAIDRALPHEHAVLPPAKELLNAFDGAAVALRSSLMAIQFQVIAMFMIGCMLYLTIILLIFYRLTFIRQDRQHCGPPYWINMGRCGQFRRWP